MKLRILRAVFAAIAAAVIGGTVYFWHESGCGCKSLCLAVGMHAGILYAIYFTIKITLKENENGKQNANNQHQGQRLCARQ